MMELLTERYADRLAGMLSCYDLIVITDCGRIPEDIALIERDGVYPSRDAFVGFWRNVAHPYTSRITSEKRALFVETGVDNLASSGHGRSDSRRDKAT